MKNFASILLLVVAGSMLCGAKTISRDASSDAYIDQVILQSHLYKRSGRSFARAPSKRGPFKGTLDFLNCVMLC